MKSGIHRIGNWTAFSRLALNLSKELRKARILCLQRWALKAEGVAKKHLSTQDLAGSYWRPLSPYTIAKKTAAGNSLHTLIETSAYFQAITSWVSIANGTAYAGVKRSAKYSNKNGDFSSIANVAKIQEEGSAVAGIPARPLWQPTYEDTMKWHLVNNKPGNIFLNNIRLKYS